jgi:aspartyl aminopeptidase
MKPNVSLAIEAMNYFDSSPDPFHAVQTSIGMLESAGFTELSDDSDFISLKRGGKYFFTRNKSTIVAFCIGEKYQPGNGFKIIGGHTDSPILKIKPRSKRSSVSSSACVQLAVECYGGGLWHTWFDRDLGLSGRVFVRNQLDQTIEQKLVNIDRSILHIPNLAIHLQSADERQAFKVNKEDHLVPILSMTVKNALEGNRISDNEEGDGWTEHQEPVLLDLLSKELNIDVQDIIDFELNLYNVQKASLGGAHSEFLHSARLDNLASCFLALKGIVEYTKDDRNHLETDGDISLVALFDHEEVGSESSTGAGSPIMGEAVSRISNAILHSDQSKNASVANTATFDVYPNTIRKSFVLSVDQAHAVHPNYMSKHEKGHGPKMNDGMVIKRNSNQRYATNAVTGLILREIARKSGLKPLQEFVVWSYH